MNKDPRFLEALEVVFDSDAGDGITVRKYLYRLLSALWEEQESFSGKRPLGNSGWEYDLYIPLVKAGFISGSIDPDGCIDLNEKQLREASAYVADLISAAIFGVQK